MSYIYIISVLKRKIYSELLKWKDSHRYCLVIRGQRQVGKTFIIEEFAKREYRDYVKLDFSEDQTLSSIFSKKNVDSIVGLISIYAGRTVSPGTLLFFDEIQESPEAYASLKAFSLDGRYDVIASGSMLGVDRKGRFSTGPDVLIPMGYEQVITMFGLDFEEFLWAAGISEEETDRLHRALKDREPFGRFLLERYLGLFKRFMVVGGMPAAVRSYFDEGMTGTGRVHEEILFSCIRDINRYTSGADTVRTTECFESIPGQLAESNKKFMFSRIDSDKARRSADRYAGNLLWIKQAGYGNFCYLVRKPEVPLSGNEVRDQFKVYLSDTGLLMHSYGTAYTGNFITGVRGDYGAVTENVVAECLMKRGIVPRYYSKKNGPGIMEIDFVLESDTGVVAVEVRSGKDIRGRSIEKLSDFFTVEKRVVLGDTDVYADDSGIWHYPIFAAAFGETFQRSEVLQFVGPSESAVRRCGGWNRRLFLSSVAFAVGVPWAKEEIHGAHSIYSFRHFWWHGVGSDKGAFSGPYGDQRPELSGEGLFIGDGICDLVVRGPVHVPGG